MLISTSTYTQCNTNDNATFTMSPNDVYIIQITHIQIQYEVGGGGEWVGRVAGGPRPLASISFL